MFVIGASGLELAKVALDLAASDAVVRGVRGLGEANGRLPEDCRCVLLGLTWASLCETARDAFRRCLRATKCRACM